MLGGLWCLMVHDTCGVHAMVEPTIIGAKYLVVHCDREVRACDGLVEN